MNVNYEKELYEIIFNWVLNCQGSEVSTVKQISKYYHLGNSLVVHMD